jgi:tRNA G18 (ribose-2'-O)-methylase SpoU
MTAAVTPGESSHAVWVTDPLDPRLDDYRELKDATRRRSGTFIAESERVILRLLESRFAVKSLLLAPQRYARLASALPVEVPTFICEEEVLNSLVGFPLHRGALALGVRPTQEPAAETLLAAAQTVVILEDVVDPDNIGAVFRHAAAFGVDAVLLSPHAGDPLYRKAIRAAMGWSLYVPWMRLSESQWPMILESMHTDGWATLALTPDADAPTLSRLIPAMAVPNEAKSSKVALLLGTEHDGLTNAAMSQASTLARIPMADGVDSLNVATTAAIALYELARRGWN